MRRWPFKLVLVLFFGTSCGQDYNSNSNDARYARGAYDINTPFGAAQVVLSDKCFSCHGSWANYTSSQAWVNSGYVAPGNWDSSIFRNRLKNYGGDMPPPPASDLTASEIQALSTWVDGL